MPAPQGLHRVGGVPRHIGDDVFGFGHGKRPSARTAQTNVASTRSRIAPTSDSSSDKGETTAQ